jgi:hypothetical protein
VKRERRQLSPQELAFRTCSRPVVRLVRRIPPPDTPYNASETQPVSKKGADPADRGQGENHEEA